MLSKDDQATVLNDSLMRELRRASIKHVIMAGCLSAVSMEAAVAAASSQAVMLTLMSGEHLRPTTFAAAVTLQIGAGAEGSHSFMATAKLSVCRLLCQWRCGQQRGPAEHPLPLPLSDAGSAGEGGG